MSEKRDVIRYIRVTEEVEERLERQAKRRGLSVTEMVRSILGDALLLMESVEPKEDRQ